MSQEDSDASVTRTGMSSSPLVPATPAIPDWYRYLFATPVVARRSAFGAMALGAVITLFFVVVILPMLVTLLTILGIFSVIAGGIYWYCHRPSRR
jgi:hypothetical protein